MRCATRSRFPLVAFAFCLAMSGMHSPAQAGPIAPAATLTLPSPDHNAFNVTTRYAPDGLLYVWDGYQVWKQNSVNGAAFAAIGKVIAGNVDPDWLSTGYHGPYNSADAGPINFSRDGARLLVGNGAGGMGGYFGVVEHNGRIWSMPIAGATVNLPGGNSPLGVVAYHNDLLPVPAGSTIANSASKYFVNQGVSTYASSSVSVFDEISGTNVPVIQNGPGATTAIAFGPDNRLYVGVGYGSSRGDIRSFALSALDAAFASGTPLDFASGSLFNPTSSNNQSGAGMFFDAHGYLFAGGNEGITCFKPDGTLANVVSTGAYTTLAYNPFNDQVLAMTTDYGTGATTGSVYSAHDLEAVPEPCSWVLVAMACVVLAVFRRGGVRN